MVCACDRFKLNISGDRSSRMDLDWSVWVGDLDVSVDDYTLHQHFLSRYQSTTSAKVVTDKTSGTSRGRFVYHC